MMESPLRQWRDKSHLTQSDLAYMAGVAQSHVTEVEKGRVALGEKLEALLKRIGDDAEEIIRLHPLYMEFVKQELVSKLSKVD